jgi:hypothetical protein
MIDKAAKRGEIIKHLEDVLAIADELQDGMTGYLAIAGPFALASDYVSAPISDI